MTESLITPALEPKFEFAFAARITLTKAFWPSAEMTQGGKRVFVGIEEGTFEGPRIKGVVLPGTGGDYAHERPDGVIDFDARYMLRADDGTMIYLQNRGFRWATPEAMQAMREQKPVDPNGYYMRLSPKFEVEAGPHDWLAKHVFVGIGEKIPRGNIIRYFRML